MFGPFARRGDGVRQRLAGRAAAAVATGKIGNPNPPVVAAAIHDPVKLRHLKFTYPIGIKDTQAFAHYGFALQAF
jgi:hypothetical protein